MNAKKKLITLVLFSFILTMLSISAYAQRCGEYSVLWDLYESKGIRVYEKFCNSTSLENAGVYVAVSNFNTTKDKKYKVTYQIKWFNFRQEWVKTTGTLTIYASPGARYSNEGIDSYPNSDYYGYYEIINLKCTKVDY